MDDKKKDFEFKVDFNKANKIRLGYIGISFLLMFGSIYKISIMGYTNSVSILSFAFSSLNLATLYFLVLVVALGVEIIVGMQEHDLVKKNKESLNWGLPAILLVFSIYFVIKGLSLRDYTMGAGSVSILLFVGVLFHAAYFGFCKFPEKFDSIISKKKD